MSEIKRARITLSQNELENAVKQFIADTVFPKVNCVGAIEFGRKDISNNQTASVDIEPAVLDPLAPSISTYYKLRYRNTKLFVEAVKIVGKRIVLSVGLDGTVWKNISDIFSDFKKCALKSNNLYKTEYDAVLLEGLKEDLLQFEIVYFGEVKTDDMTFHINELGKM